MVGREQQAPVRAARVADERRPLGAGRVEHGEGVGRELLLRYAAGSVGRSERPLPRASNVTTR